MSSSSVQDSPVKVVHESDTVARITLKDKEILLLGTAHVSHESVEQVSAVIREEKPDQVCVEIDAGRYQSISKKENWEQMNLNKVFREKKGFLLLANLVMAAFQRKVGLNTGIKPGEEMKRAIEVAKELEIPFSFSDRPVQISL
jgi:pheromone shutdown protein TraB